MQQKIRHFVLQIAVGFECLDCLYKPYRHSLLLKAHSTDQQLVRGKPSDVWSFSAKFETVWTKKREHCVDMQMRVGAG